MDATENFNKLVFNLILGFFLFRLLAITNLERIHFFIYLIIN